MNWSLGLDEVALTDIALIPALINMVLVLALAQILSWHYMKFAQVLSNKPKFARLFLMVAPTTMLMISVVKTSLALSLGLVGALSVIRFRTPIKEPEELAYLFLAVAAGIGLGADQRLVTCILFLVILAYLAIRSWRTADAAQPRVLINVSTNLDSGGPKPLNAESALSRLMAQLGQETTKVDVRRVDVDNQVFNVNLTTVRLKVE